MMELGAVDVQAQQPLCDTCPVQKICRAYQSDKVFHYPIKLKKPSTLNIALPWAWFLKTAGF